MVTYILGAMFTYIIIAIVVNEQIGDDPWGWIFTILEMSILFPVFWTTVIIGNLYRIWKRRKK